MIAFDADENRQTERRLRPEMNFGQFEKQSFWYVVACFFVVVVVVVVENVCRTNVDKMRVANLTKWRKVVCHINRIMTHSPQVHS